MNSQSWRTPFVVLVCGSLILTMTFGIRQTYGLLMEPVSTEQGWGREVFALAVALQSLIWGLAQPVWGGIADRYGPGRVVAASAVIYAAGLYLMAQSTTPLEMHFSTGILTGIGLSGTSFPIMLAVIARAAPPHRRSLYLAIGSAAGSSGQLLMVPIGQGIISGYGYVTALIVLAMIAALVVPLSATVAGRRRPADQPLSDQTVPEAIREARGHGGFLLLIAGFFVCGFQTMFIGAHLPAYLSDAGADPMLGATALATIGLFNIIGCFVWGAFADKFSKKYMLAMLYVLRSICMVVFISVPMSEVSVLLFSAAMGLLWLATIPLTSGIVAQMFGTQYMSMLYGFVFLNHQLGSFLGIWLGGRLYDQTGSYDVIWWIAIALGLVAALVHWPIDERAVPRLAPQQAPE